MKYLLDTNIISEIRKSQPNPHVAAWLKTIPVNQRYLSVIVMGEIRRGVEKQRVRDNAYAMRLEAWLEMLTVEYKNRILPFDLKSANQWGLLPMSNPAHALDLQMAATALVNGCTMVTRNVTHFTGIVPQIINPFEPIGHA